MREIDDDEGRRLVRNIRRGSGSVAPPTNEAIAGGVPNPAADLAGVSAAQRAMAAPCSGSVSAAVSVGYVTPDVMGMLGDPLDGSLINEVR